MINIKRFFKKRATKTEKRVERVFVKLDMDDILEIVIEHFQIRDKNLSNAKGIILGEPQNDLRFIGVFGLDEDDEIFKFDLEDIDKKIDYNGFHSYLKKHPEWGIAKDNIETKME